MTIEFLKKVLPEGLIVIARPAATKGFVQVVCDSIEKAAAQAEKFDTQGHDCYFALGSLVQPFVMELRNGKEVKAIRVGQNIQELKCLFLDLDVEAGNPRKYESQIEAVTALRTFCHDEGFPAPMIVSSGGGIHVYWPFDKPVATDQWRTLAQAFKAALSVYGLKADPTRTADASSVLRVVGTHNHKSGMKRPVELVKDVTPYPRKQMLLAVMKLVEKYGIELTPVVAKKEVSDLGSNLDRQFEPSDFNKVIEHCAQLKELVRTGGDSEPVWYAGLSIAKHSADPHVAAMLISQAYPGFDETEMKRKLYQLEGKGIGPAKCGQFTITNPKLCAGCIHRGKITSPIQLGHEVLRHIPIVVEVPDGLGGMVKEEKPHMPHPYVMDDRGRLTIKGENGSEATIIHDYAIIPLRRTHSERFGVESTVWQADIPKKGKTEITIEQSLLAKPESLHGELLAKGVYATNGRIKLLVSYMTAYIKELQKVEITEQLFSRLGWREENTKFVLGDTIYAADGSATPHTLSPEIKAEVPGLRRAGDLEGWKQAIQFYNAPGHEAHRFMLYCGFGSPLLHMTGHKGVIVNGTGAPGAGKTTAIGAAASIFGHPVDLLFNGTKAGSTVNAMYSSLAAYHNIPFGMDEITRIDPKILGDFALSVSQGMGKMVNTRAGMLSHNRPSWATMVLTSANTDVYVALGQSRSDAAAEAMRVLQIPFETPHTHTKTSADQFLRDLKTHHGVAGHVFMPYITGNYALVSQRIAAVMAMVDAKAIISSGERFWSGSIAAAFTGALIARKLGLLDGFPIEHDFEWVIGQISSSRKSMVEHIASPKEVLSEFLEARVGETLVVSQTLKANIAPRVDQAPRGALCIRHEVDAQRVYIMKSEFKRYCVEVGANYGAIQSELEDLMVLVERNKQIVLGKGTDFGKGQVRCWEIDLKRLNGDRNENNT